MSKYHLNANHIKISRNWNLTRPIYGFVADILVHLFIDPNYISDSTIIASESTRPIYFTKSVYVFRLIYQAPPPVPAPMAERNLYVDRIIS